MELGCCKHCINFKYSHLRRERSDTSHKLETVFLKLCVGFCFQQLQLVQMLDFRSVIYVLFENADKRQIPRNLCLNSEFCHRGPTL